MDGLKVIQINIGNMRFISSLSVLMFLLTLLKTSQGQCHPGCQYCWWQNDPYGCWYCINNYIEDNYSWWYYHCYCPAGTVDVGWSYCPSCYYQCSTCVSSQSYCTSCSSSTRPSTPSCACRPGLYDVGSANCQPCSYKCATCQFSATYCTSCSSGTRPSTPNCACANGYFQAGIVTCPPCSYQCYTCTSTSTTCTSCPSTRSGTPNCACSPGYYQVGITNCPLCHYSCTTCNGAGSSACTTCTGFQRYISSTSCLCYNPYYDNGITNNCQPCHYSCTSCTSSSSCTSCDQSKYRYLASTSNYCICKENYFDNGVQLCVSCHVTCYRCVGANNNQCISCDNTLMRTLSGSTCICSNGYYAVSVSSITCLKCDYSCLTCTAAGPTSCSTCNATLSRTLSSNQCPCSAGYFQNSTKLCDTCHPSCATCINKTACITCIASKATTINSSSLCSCTSSQYYTGTACAACNYKCLTCTGTSTNCTSCPASSFRVYKTNACNCINNYYDSGEVVCAGCSYSCLTCSNATKTGCLSCSPASLRTLSGSTCSCPTGYYDDGANSTCNPCNYKCLTCAYSFNCTTCSAVNFRSLSAATHFCQCYSTYFQSNQICYPCLDVCLTCTNNLTCTTCSAALFLTLNPINNLCICTTGYYNNSGTCLPCMALCTSCQTATTCLTCTPGLNRVYNPTTSTCDCDTQYVLNTTSNLCLSCQYSCQTCQTNFINRCQVCNTSQFRTFNTSTKQCPCNTGYYDPGEPLCLPCSYTCFTCASNTNNCTACPVGTERTLNSVAGTCACNQHFYDTMVEFLQSANCAACLYHCSSCNNGSACLTCNASNHREFDSQNVKCICSQGYYDNGVQLCLPCPYTCLSCTNTSACVTCSSSANRAIPASLCPCINNYYDGGVPICPSCHYSCKTCTNNNKCVTCESSYNRVKNSTTGLCSCLGRYYDPGTQICSSCSYSCLTCVNSPTNCLTCTASSFRILTSNSCPCKNGYYDSAVELCKKCHYSCFTCGNSLSCLSCQANNHRKMSASTGLCVCFDGYYDDNITQPCVQCNLTCLTCINSTTCKTCDLNRFRTYNITPNYAGIINPFCSCLYGYYSLGANNSCAQCNYPCSECSGPNINNCLYCDPDSMRTLTSSGTCKCNIGYYDTNSSTVCPPCSPACESCWDGLTTTCFTCNPTFFLMLGKNTCYDTCPTYYFDNTTAMICQICSSHCLVCINSTTCTKCQSPTFLDLAACVNQCRIEYYANATVQECLPCRIGCANCSTSYNCFKCTNSSFYVDIATTQCLECSSLCVSCFGPTASQCLNCTYPLFLNAQYTCTPLQCPFGQYIDTFLGCVNCSLLFSNSLTCNISQALLCHATTQLRNGRCVNCGQVPGYAIDSAGDCNQICGDGILIRYQCDDGNNRNGDGCSSNCLIEQGWTCTNVSGKSKCSLSVGVSMRLKSSYKYPRQNKLRIALQISLPLYLTGSNFFLTVAGLSNKQYSYNVLEQFPSDLTEIALVLDYSQSIQSKVILLAYSAGSRLLQENNQSSSQFALSERRLNTINFQTQVTISAFPPATYITASTTNFYEVATTLIYYLSIVLVCTNFIIVPKRYGLHSLTFAWIVPFIYITYYRATAYTTQWVSSTVVDIVYQSLFGGISLGDCCISDTLKNTTSQIFKNSGFIFLGIVMFWCLLLLVKLINICCGNAKLSNISSILRYYLFTLHLTVFLQLVYSSLYAIVNYKLTNRIDAGNITLSLFIMLASFFFVVTLWYTTCNSHFEGTQEELLSKAATHNSNQQNSSRTEQREYNQIINVSQIKETTRYEESNFYQSGTFKSKRPSSSSSLKEKDNQNQRGESILRGEKEIGSEQSMFPYDYCLLYKNNDKRTKYFLPLLMTKLLCIGILTVSAQNAFYLMVFNTLISLLFCLYLVIIRPFNSIFTNIRTIIIEGLVCILNGGFCVYQFYALSKIYIQILQIGVLVGIMAILALSIIFSFIEHYRIWIHKIWNLCDGCFLYFRLLGKSQKVYDVQDKKRQKINVQAISEGEVVQSDAFYARVLKKQALNSLYKKQRMIPRQNLEKDFL